MYALVMAGGEGKRFWPLSKKESPKQFLKLIGERSMIRITVDRILPLVPIEKIFIVTLERYADETLKHIPELPEENLVLEPEGKNTAPCIALGTLKIGRLDPGATVLVLPADHAIGEEEGFRDAVLFGKDAAERPLSDGSFPLITFGVKPTAPETGYGYIKTGKPLWRRGDYEVRIVDRFVEKPDQEKAEEFLKKGGFLWNSGIFVWKIPAILSAYKTHLPSWCTPLYKVSDSLGTHREKEFTTQFYREIETGPVDKLILEKTKNALVIPVEFTWSDLGSWKALDEFLKPDPGENTFRGEVFAVDSSGCLVYGSKRLIALVGVKDLVVVDTEDAILVLNKDRAQEVRTVVGLLEKEGK